MIARLWLEITIAGFFYLAAIFFIILKIFGIEDLKFIDKVRDYMPYLSVGAVAMSYLFGIVFHRLLSSLVQPLLIFVENRLGLHVFNLIGGHPGWTGIDLNKIWQHGSERLQREIDFQFNQLALLRLLVIGIPLFGISAGVWLSSVIATKYILIIFIVFLVLGIALFYAYREHRIHFFKLRDDAFKELNIKVGKLNKNKS